MTGTVRSTFLVTVMSSPCPPTRLATPTSTFSWVILAFSRYEGGRVFSSPYFTYEGRTLQLILQPTGLNLPGASTCNAQVSLYLALVSEHTNLQLNYAISIMKRDESMWNVKGTARLLVIQLDNLISLSLPILQPVKRTLSARRRSSTTGSTTSLGHTFSILQMSSSATTIR